MSKPLVITKMTLDEIAEELDGIRETNLDALSISDSALFDMWIHAVRAKDPNHDHAHCDSCDYFGFNREAKVQDDNQ